ncbi:MAG TPA: AMP-binding protein [Micromonosporaceae bacterium]|nr:AMP-binding protein [Micromonosporaceae bacterium]
MFETGVRQFRLAMSMTWGRRINTDVLGAMVADALATLAEFGEPGADVAQLVDGPFADPAVRRDFTDRAIRRTAKRLATRSAWFEGRFTATGIDPAKLDADSVRRVPVMTKADLIAHGRELLCGDAPTMSTRTTGSTGRPAEVLMSRYEAELWPALAALSGLLRDEIRPTDVMAVCISSRATAAVQQNISVCRHVGAQVRVIGVIPPNEALDALLGPAGATLLATYPSYLAVLVTAARNRDLGPADFRLRRVDVGGEVLSPALAAAARATLGAALVNDTFAMTEVLPVSGRSCSAGHLHHDLNTGLVEVIALESGEPAKPGELGTAVITPYYPYRECMPVFRYDTRDLISPIAPENLACELAAVPATSAILGKASDLLVTPSGRSLHPRAIIEALESLPTEPWPVRYRAEVAGERFVLTIDTSTAGGLDADGVTRHLAERGVDADVRVVAAGEASTLRRVRADLSETTFMQPSTLVGVGG